MSFFRLYKTLRQTWEKRLLRWNSYQKTSGTCGETYVLSCMVRSIYRVLITGGRAQALADLQNAVQSMAEQDQELRRSIVHEVRTIAGLSPLFDTIFRIIDGTCNGTIYSTCDLSLFHLLRIEELTVDLFRIQHSDVLSVVASTVGNQLESTHQLAHKQLLDNLLISVRIFVPVTSSIPLILLLD